MGLDLTFADSFDHYNLAGIPLKWTTGGGVVDTTPSRVRTGTQSLRIQSGDSPTVGGFAPSSLVGVASGYTMTGFAWQTSSLAGETICEWWYTNGLAQRVVYLVQNANGSLSLWADNPATLLASTPAGTITTNTFWYIEVALQLLTGYLGPVQAVLTVTNCATNVATELINITGFSTVQLSWDTVKWGGPSGADYAWIDDFYILSSWDNTGDPLKVYGAPKIYACVPYADGVSYVATNTIGKTIPFPGTPAPWWNQVNEIPQSTVAPIFETDESVTIPGTIGGWIVCGQDFLFDVSALPVNSPISAIQLTVLYAASAGDQINQSILGALFALNIAAHSSVPYRFYELGYQFNPTSGLPWSYADLIGAGAHQFGPFIAEPQ